MPGKTFYLLSLGCAKNTVDSASISHQLKSEGFQEVSNHKKADVIIVNTCGFIADARDESIREIKRLSKNKSKQQMLIAAGCLSQRYGKELIQQVTGINGVLGTQSWMHMVELITRLQATQDKILQVSHASSYPVYPADVPQYAIQGGSAYLKIADGCRHTCSFCAIPLIKGISRSRPIKAILDDAEHLQGKGIKELILIAQDSTDYGSDLGFKDGLPQLLDALVLGCPDIPWIRIMYAYPGLITSKLIDRIARNRQIIPYIDIPLQHANVSILRSMKRPHDIEWIYRTITNLRASVPNIAIRSTFIVGYPGESEADFSELLEFIQTIRFDRVGAFLYSCEEGTPAESLGDPISSDIKQDRLNRLMEVQQSISLALNQQWVGKTLDVLVEGKQSGFLIGRSFRDAPEIDGLILAQGDYPVGQICKVQITGAMEYDLTGFVKK